MLPCAAVYADVQQFPHWSIFTGKSSVYMLRSMHSIGTWQAKTCKVARELHACNKHAELTLQFCTGFNIV